MIKQRVGSNSGHIIGADQHGTRSLFVTLRQTLKQECGETLSCNFALLAMLILVG